MFKFTHIVSYLTVFIVISLILTGCSEDETQTDRTLTLQAQLSEQEETIAELTRDNQALRASIQQLQRPQNFSYIEQLDEEARGHYQAFLETNDLTHFESFTSDEMFVVFLHSVVTGEDGVSTSILYNDESFDDFTDLQAYYQEELFREYLETALDFRYFYDLHVDEIQSRTDKDIVKMSVRFELFSATHVAELRRQDGIWKVYAGPYD
ncbi:hypothetical protein HMI01_02400 [Halolactibacillus miurensis]|uniref:Uncharacterized protein n=1 Tax=Halolactibacillus miurensis TaxID=306541 RepID=A0A1I6Q6D9_9BACI|nr:hypothetical protein [Halolactibacillus miurensis]GEM03252.1 hypothetical protein HMI01_02400 [Halolactibacillus miurensis]SFS48029.1 hypothetical protein SAMN05421668_103134 [Halolactibacillus miurensis]